MIDTSNRSAELSPLLAESKRLMEQLIDISLKLARLRSQIEVRVSDLLDSDMSSDEMPTVKLTSPSRSD
jgi:hypothetical protein